MSRRKPTAASESPHIQLKILRSAMAGLMVTSYGATDLGKRRQVNEDAYLCDDELGLWVVADGMGGHAAGEVASRESIDTVFGMVRRGKQSLQLDGEPTEEKARAACRVLEGAVQAATYLVFAMAE